MVRPPTPQGRLCGLVVALQLALLISQGSPQCGLGGQANRGSRYGCVFPSHGPVAVKLPWTIVAGLHWEEVLFGMT